MSNIIKPVFPHSSTNSSRPEEATPPPPGYQLQVELAFSTPAIWRRFQLPGDASLLDLHRVIQTCFDWDDSHSHRFLIGKIFYGPAESADAKSTFDENTMQLHQLEESMGFIFTYLYDAGDGWECELRLEQILAPGTAGRQPQLVAGDRACPPAAFPDIHEYQQWLSRLVDAAPGSHTKIFAEYDLATTFDPSYCDEQCLRRRLDSLATR